MVEYHPKPERPWREIAEEVSTESDAGKVAELSQELIKALDERHRTRQSTIQSRSAESRLRATAGFEIDADKLPERITTVEERDLRRH